MISFFGNLVMFCLDDEDDCRFEGFGLEENLGESGLVVEELGIFFEVLGENEINENKILNNNSKKNFLKGFFFKVFEVEIEGELDIL